MKDFKSMKYAELRSLAKKAGIKANQKHDKLVEDLIKHDEKQNSLEKKLESAPKVNKTLAKKTPPPKAPQTKPISKPATPASKVNTPVTKVVSTVPTVPKVPTQKSTPLILKKQALTSRGAASPKTTPVTPSGKLQPTKRKHQETPMTPEPSKKRRSTFEKAPTPDLSIPEVSAGSGNRRNSNKIVTPKAANVARPQADRTSKGQVDSPKGKGQSNSPGVKDMLGAMRPEMTDEEMKTSLMSVIDKKVQIIAKEAPVSSSIPRFVAFVKNRQQAKPITPGNKDWEKIHEKNFSKFDSIDVYLQKKRKRAEEMTASVKKAKMMVAETTKAVNKLKARKTPATPQGIENKKPRLSQNKNQTTPFIPTVFSTDKMDLNFGKMAVPKTLPHKSPKAVFGSAIKKAGSSMDTRKSTGNIAPRKSTVTPFKFVGAPNASLNVTTSTAKKFDLKASLSRPLTWRPHKGKLKPLDANSPLMKKPISVTKTKIRENTRMTVAQRRTMKKEDAQMSRRGIPV